MSTLNIFAQLDQVLDIATITDLKAAIPITPDVPSIFCLDVDHSSIQIVYGSPDCHHAEVKRYTGAGIEKETFDTFKAATDRFLALCQTALH